MAPSALMTSHCNPSPALLGHRLFVECWFCSLFKTHSLKLHNSGVILRNRTGVSGAMLTMRYSFGHFIVLKLLASTCSYGGLQHGCIRAHIPLALWATDGLTVVSIKLPLSLPSPGPPIRRVWITRGRISFSPSQTKR